MKSELASIPISSGVIFKEIHLPKCIEGTGLVSVAPAKDHTITGVTLGLKNRVGYLPVWHYSGYWTFKKSRIHQWDEDQAVADLMLYLEPCLTIIDTRLGLKGGYLSGRIPEPPLGRLPARTDVLEVDRTAAALLGHDPSKIRHLVPAEKARADRAPSGIGNSL